MSLVDVDSWITEYDACDRLSSDIQSQIGQRKAQSTKSAEFAKFSGIIRMRLKQLSSDLIQLNSAVGSVNITRAEEERRRRQIETLQSKLIHLQTQFADQNEVNNRAQLFQQTAPSLWGNGDDDDDVRFDAQHLAGGSRASTSGGAQHGGNVHDLRREQDRIMDQQDAGLDDLAKIISRQKNLALRIGNEVEEQNDIIDNLAGDVERVDSRINSETRHIRMVSTMESSTFYYWLVIIGLFMAIVVVALL